MVLGYLRGFFMISAPILGDIQYAEVLPLAPFLFHMLVDVFLRKSLLLMMPRTFMVAKECKLQRATI